MTGNENETNINEKGNAHLYRVIGTRPLRPDAVDKVTGRAQFASDLQLPGLLYGAVLRSPHAHARILSIDTHQAEAFPGVKAVVTSTDLPGSSYQRDNVLAGRKVLYHGHAVAAVAATSIHIAQEALELIDVKYELLPPVLDVRQAMRDEAQILLDDLRMDDLGTKLDKPTNIASHQRFKHGDLEKGFQEATVVVEKEFFTSTVHQGYIEPQNATAVVNADGQVTIWCSTQGLFGVRGQISDLLDIPLTKIRVIPMEVGGGFGGKNTVYLEPLAVLLSKKSGFHPVRLVMSYAEVLAGTGPTSGSYIHIKMGADRNGRITAAEATLIYEAGAYPGSPIGMGMEVIISPYRIDNVQVDGYDVVVNKPVASTYRAPGGTNAVFACETVVDELCEKLGMDPLDFRTLNGVKEGDRLVNGRICNRIGFLETLEAARKHPHYSAPLHPGEGDPNMTFGRGVAACFWGNYGGTSSASASLNPDGTINLITGSVDLSGTRTTIAMQLAETLGIAVEDIKTIVGDTDSVGFTEGSYGSRTTFATGWAVYELGKDLLRLLTARAAELWDVNPEEVTFANGVFSSEGRELTFKEITSRLDETGGPIVASVSSRPETEGPGFGVHIVDIQVDPETGKVEILRYTAVQDVGKAVHPTFVEGQIQGGVAQGIGWGLHEGYFYDGQGHLLNASLLDYRLPTCLDLPMIETVLVEVPNPGHPYGVRGVGEVPILPPPAAIANAIYQAVGVRMNVLPMAPGKVLEANWQKQ